MGNPPLKIVIIGAGIAGFTAAISLRRQGHQIYESSSFSKELGAALHVAPNSNGVLKGLGVSVKDTGADNFDYFTEFNLAGQEVFSRTMAGWKAHWQHEWLMAHRVKLHNALKEAAITSTGIGTPAILHLASPVTDLDPMRGIVHFKDGSSVSGDVIIGADGVHSVSRRSVPGANHEPHATGHSAFRWLVSRDEVLKDAVGRRLFEKGGSMIGVFGDRRMIIAYTTSNSTLVNVAAFVPSDGTKSNQGWGSQGSREELLRYYKDVHPDFVTFLSMAKEDTLKKWEMLDMETATEWTCGKLVLIGDSAHPFLPYQGQGAAMAIEDAGALGVVLEQGVQPDEIEERIRLFQAIRKPRVDTILERTRLSGPQNFSSAASFVRNRANGNDDANLSHSSAFNNNHDAVDNANQRLREWKLSKAGYDARLISVFDSAPASLGHVNGLADFTMVSLTIKSSLTLLKGLLPLGEKWSIREPGTYAYFSFVASQNRWSTGKTTSVLRFYLHHIQKEGTDCHDTAAFVPIGFASSPESSQELQVVSETTIEQKDDAYQVLASCSGLNWLSIDLTDLKLLDYATQALSSNLLSSDKNLFLHRYQPRVVINSTNVVELSNTTVVPLPDQVSDLQIRQVLSTNQVKLSLSPSTDEKLKDINHIIQRLAELPVYSIQNARLVTGQGNLDTPAAVMLSQAPELSIS